MENQILKGEITEITPDGKWNDFSKFKVKIKNAQQEVGEFNFLAKGNF